MSTLEMHPQPFQACCHQAIRALSRARLHPALLNNV